MNEMDTVKKKAEFLTLFPDAQGNVMMTCRKLNMSRSTYYLWMTTDKDFAEQANDVQEGLIDMTETYLHKNIKNGNVAAQIFFLKTKAKNRGYIETQDHTTGGKPIHNLDLSKVPTELLEKLYEHIEE
jgi:uncharacterized protein YxeA